MRAIYLFLYLALVPAVSFAQGRIGYGYDASGNRVKREIVMPVQKNMAKQQNYSIENHRFSDMLRDHSIKIFPNLTNESLNICTSGLKETDESFLEVYTSRGMQVLKKSIETDNIDISISNLPTGIYLLKITINDDATTWKIIKK